MFRTIADFAPADSEAGTGLVIQDEEGRYLFFLAGTRHRCPPGQLFYAGIGGHRELGEDFLACAHREAREEIGTDIEIFSAPATWFIPQQQPIQQVYLVDQPRPLALYEMIHPPNTPRAGQLYRIVIYQARMNGRPQNMPPDEIRGIIALTEKQVAQGWQRKPRLAELIAEGALLVASNEVVDSQTRLYPLGTARALSHLYHFLSNAGRKT